MPVQFRTLQPRQFQTTHPAVTQRGGKQNNCHLQKRSQDKNSSVLAQLERRTRGNYREDGAHEILKEATTVSTEFFSEEAAVFFQRTITDGSLPRNALLRSPQSTNDSGACTPPISQ